MNMSQGLKLNKRVFESYIHIVNAKIALDLATARNSRSILSHKENAALLEILCKICRNSLMFLLKVRFVPGADLVSAPSASATRTRPDQASSPASTASWLPTRSSPAPSWGTASSARPSRAAPWWTTASSRASFSSKKSSQKIRPITFSTKNALSKTRQVRKMDWNQLFRPLPPPPPP